VKSAADGSMLPIKAEPGTPTYDEDSMDAQGTLKVGITDWFQPDYDCQFNE